MLSGRRAANHCIGSTTQTRPCGRCCSRASARASAEPPPPASDPAPTPEPAFVVASATKRGPSSDDVNDKVVDESEEEEIVRARGGVTVSRPEPLSSDNAEPHGSKAADLCVDAMMQDVSRCSRPSSGDHFTEASHVAEIAAPGLSSGGGRRGDKVSEGVDCDEKAGHRGASRSRGQADPQTREDGGVAANRSGRGTRAAEAAARSRAALALKVEKRPNQRGSGGGPDGSMDSGGGSDDGALDSDDFAMSDDEGSEVMPLAPDPTSACDP